MIGMYNKNKRKYSAIDITVSSQSRSQQDHIVLSILKIIKNNHFLTIYQTNDALLCDMVPGFIKSKAEPVYEFSIERRNTMR